MINTAAFKKWFGDSKVVDAEGRPLVVYHGTGDTPFTVFKPGIPNTITVSRTGFYFADDENASKEFGSTIIQAYLSLQNPADFVNENNDTQKQILETIVKGLPEKERPEYFDEDDGRPLSPYKVNRSGLMQTDAFIKSAKQSGYDGLIIPDALGRSLYFTSYIAFKPTQIKSATGNDGSFDADDSDIRSNPPTPIKRDIESPEFKQWFGKSVVREERKLGKFDGPPRLVYHGTDKDFKTFEKKSGKRSILFSTFNVVSNGFFFSPLRKDAKTYGKIIIPAFIKLERPLLDFYAHPKYGQELVPPKLAKDLKYILEPAARAKKYSTQDLKNMPDWIYEFISFGKLTWEALDNPEVVERMIKRGYDGTFVAENNDDSGYSLFVVDVSQIAVAMEEPAPESDDDEYHDEYYDEDE